MENGLKATGRIVAFPTLTNSTKLFSVFFFPDLYDGQIARGQREDVILWHKLGSEKRER